MSHQIAACGIDARRSRAMGGNWEPTRPHQPFVVRVIMIGALTVVVVFAALALIKTALSMLSATMLAFAVTPGGLLVLVLVFGWHWLGRPVVRDDKPEPREWWRG